MQVSANGRKFIEEFEGLRLTAYKDAVGILTIGYGHTEGVHAGMTITPEQADMLLAVDVEHVENALNKLIPPDCTQNQFDALVDFGFNLGTGALQQLLSHGWDQVPYQLYHEDEDGTQHGWIRAGGKILPGLVKRRQAEVALFVE